MTTKKDTTTTTPEAPAVASAPRAPKVTAREKAQAAVDVLDRKLTRNRKTYAQLEADLSVLATEHATLTAERDYAASNPRLRDDTATPTTTTTPEETP